jgi:hypothetical protein
LPRRGEDRVTIAARPGGIEVRIHPLVRERAWRLRLAAVAAVVAGAAIAGSIRLGPAWEAGLKKGDFGDLPLSVLIPLSLAVLVSTPLALLGLAALAFAEERIEVGVDEISIETTAFERTRTTTILRAELDCWRETRWPLSPWWTWAVTRLAARSGGKLHPCAAAAGPKEKRAIGKALAGATGKPLIGDFGRRIL